jgi:hypothetical protein
MTPFHKRDAGRSPLVIEVDGGPHMERAVQDALRSAYLQRGGSNAQDKSKGEKRSSDSLTYPLPEGEGPEVTPSHLPNVQTPGTGFEPVRPGAAWPNARRCCDCACGRERLGGAARVVRSQAEPGNETFHRAAQRIAEVVDQGARQAKPAVQQIPHLRPPCVRASAR